MEDVNQTTETETKTTGSKVKIALLQSCKNGLSNIRQNLIETEVDRMMKK